MKAAIDSVLIALEALQEEVLAHPSKPGTAFSALACSALHAVRFSWGYEAEVLGLV